MRRVIRCFPVVLLMVLASASAFGADLAAGRQAYIAHDFDAAIAAVEDGKDAGSYTLLALAHTERYAIFKNKHDKKQAKMYRDLLDVELQLADAPMISSLMEVPGNPNGNKLANKLVVKCFDNARSTPEDMLLLGEFLNDRHGIDTNKVAAKRLSKLLKPVRDYVKKGGTMPENMRTQVFSSPDLIRGLVSALAHKKVAGSAKKCLVLIEEPAIPFLQEAEMNEQVSKSIIAVRKAVEKRLKKYPSSTWHSATGT